MSATRKYQRIAFVASHGAEAQQALAQLVAEFGNSEPEKADVIVALGGDGLMLQTLHRYMRSETPIYGMHRGTVGFLMNEFSQRSLLDRLEAWGRRNGRTPPDLTQCRDALRGELRSKARQPAPKRLNLFQPCWRSVP